MDNAVATVETQTAATMPKTNLVEAASGIDADARAKLTNTLEQLDQLQPGLNIAPIYQEFTSQGEKARGIFMGYLQLDITDKETGEVKTLESVAWMDEKQNIYQNAGASLVSTFVSNNVAQYTPVEIELTGTKKVPKGNMKVYSVRPLVQAQQPEADK